MNLGLMLILILMLRLGILVLAVFLILILLVGIILFDLQFPCWMLIGYFVHHDLCFFLPQVHGHKAITKLIKVTLGISFFDSALI